MKKLIVLFMFFGSFVIHAQSSQDYMNAIKESASIDLKAIVYEGLDLNDTELNKFDPLFDNYLNEDGNLALEKFVMFEKYAERTETLSEDQFNDLNLELLKNELAQAKLNRKYYKKFVKAIGVEKTTGFFFLTRYIDNVAESAKLDFLSR